MMTDRLSEKLAFFCLLLSFPHLGNTIWGEINGWCAGIGKGPPDTVTWLTRCVSPRKKSEQQEQLLRHLYPPSQGQPFKKIFELLGKWVCRCLVEKHQQAYPLIRGLPGKQWPKPLRATDCFPRSLLWWQQGLWLAGLSVRVEQSCSLIYSCFWLQKMLPTFQTSFFWTLGNSPCWGGGAATHVSWCY